MTDSTELEQKRLAELEDAFELFNQTSTQLTFAYESLQNQVEDLQRQLVESNIEKHRVGERLEQLLNLLPAAVIVLDLDDVVIDMNPAAVAMLGADARHRPWVEVTRNVFLTSNNAGTFMTHNEQVFQLSETPLTLSNEDQNSPLIGRILLVQDVTDARNLQQHIDRHQRLSSMGEMTASLAHQIRTPLASALLYVSQLNSDHLDDDKRMKFVDKSVNSLHHLESLVKDMLQYAKGGKAHDKPVMIVELIQRLTQSVEDRVAQSHSILTVANFDESFQVLGDIDALQTALQNLIINAMDVIPEQAEIHIAIEEKFHKSSRHIPCINIKVSDNGPGLNEEVMTKIFEPFYTRRAQGTGLGLAVVRAVADAHDGEAWVKSIQGEGATFVLTLPLYQVKESL